MDHTNEYCINVLQFLLGCHWVLSHWVHFTVHSLDLVVFIGVYFGFFSILHIRCVIVSRVGWT